MIISIQYLRALAVVLVLLHHVFGYFGGAQGVDIFFVISGFLMAHIMESKKYNGIDFFLSRYLRIAPAYYLVTLVNLVFGFAFLPTVEHVFYSFIFLSRFWPNGLEPILTVGWTLEYEFIFYALCALSLLLFKDSKIKYVFIVLSLSAITIFKDLMRHPNNFNGLFIEFIFGIFIYFILNKFRFNFQRSCTFLLGAVLSSFIALYFIQSFFVYNNLVPFRFFWYGVPSVVLVFAVLSIDKYFHVKKISPLVFLGDSSYSIYLVHPIVIGLFRKFINFNQSFFGNIMSLFLSIVVGGLFYVFIENKMRLVTSKIKNKAILYFKTIRVVT